MSTRILVVEDNPMNKELVVDLLEGQGFEVLCATTAEHGLEIANSHRPDLILMDINLPGMYGDEATKILRADPSFKDLPIVALTSSAMPGERARIMEAGFNSYMTKPFDLRELLSLIESLLNRTVS